MTIIKAVIDKSMLAVILPMLSSIDDYKVLSDKPISVSVERVLAKAWRANRLARCERLLAEGKKPPPVHLVRYRLNGESWYGVSDGNHRVVAASNAGNKTIRAVVTCESPIRPERYVIIKNVLWRNAYNERYGRYLQEVQADIAPEMVAALLSIGVGK